jgi:hypothetical protein
MISNIKIKNLAYYENASIDLKKITIFTGPYETKIAILLNTLLQIRNAGFLGMSDLFHVLSQHNIITDTKYPLEVSISQDEFDHKIALNEEGSVTTGFIDHCDLFKDNFCYIGPNRSTKIASCRKHTCVTRQYIHYHKLMDEINDVFPSIINEDEYIYVHSTVDNYQLFNYFGSPFIINKRDTSTILEYRLMNLSGGMLGVLPIISALLTPQFNKTILIYTPELGLHPASQSALTKLIAKFIKNDIQIIMVVQMDHIFNGLRVLVKQEKLNPEDVIIYHTTKFNNKDPFHKITIKEDGQFSDYPESFMDQYDKDLMYLIGW